MKKKLQHNKAFNIQSIDDLKDLQQALYDVEEKSPVLLKFLELYCGYNTAVLSSDPYEISYSQGKRDVILTLKTIMRKDIDLKAILQSFNN